MIRVDARVARALAHLKSPELTPFVEFLAAQRQTVLESMAQSNAEQMIYRLQGEAALLKEVLELIETADTLVAKLK